MRIKKRKEEKMIQKEITFDRFIRWIIVALIVVAVFFGVNYLSNALLPFFVAWFLSYLIFPIVRGVERYLHIRIRAISIIITMLLVGGVLAGVVWAIIPPMIEQFEKLGNIVIGYVHSRVHITSIPDALGGLLIEHRDAVEAFFRSKDFTEMVKTAAPGVMGVLSETFSVLYSIVASCIVLLYMFFILYDYEYLSENWAKVFPASSRPFWQSVMSDVERAMNNYVRGQSLVSLIMAILFSVFFTIIDFPMAIGLGILIGIMNLVPYLHTFALIPAAFLALLKAADTGENFWIVFASAVAVFCIVQVINDMIVVPKVMGRAMGMNPALLLLSLSVWGTLLGFIGLIIALPLTTIIMAYWKRYVSGDMPTETEQKKNSDDTQ